MFIDVTRLVMSVACAATPSSDASGVRPVVVPAVVMQVGRQLEPAALTEVKTRFDDALARDYLLGDHDLTLQWISWDFVGRATVTDDQGLLRIKGSQWSKNEKDYVTIDGVILSASQREFVFYGTVVTRSDIVNARQPCEKHGSMTFRRSGQRIHWRLQQMDNCEGGRVVDYVDVYLKPEHRPQKKGATSSRAAPR